MDGPKLEVARRCAAWLVRRLALVDVDDEVRLPAPLGADRARRDDALAGVRAGGATNLSGGWLKGLEQLAAVPEVASRTILLLTDGLANVGITGAPTLVALAAAARCDGIRTATVGVGDGFDEELLTAMADAGGGNAHFAATPDAAPGIFSREPAVAVPGGMQLQAGDLAAGERRRIVAELHIPHLPASAPPPCARWWCATSRWARRWRTGSCACRWW